MRQRKFFHAQYVCIIAYFLSFSQKLARNSDQISGVPSPDLRPTLENSGGSHLRVFVQLRIWRQQNFSESADLEKLFDPLQK
jgi:hypothetical protein